MNANRHQGATPFAPETQFAPQPVTGVPFRASLENEFDQIKRRLLARQLETAPPPALNALIRRAANEAAALAWTTGYPLLTFPGLFEEKTATAVRQAERQARIYANTRELVCA